MKTIVIIFAVTGLIFNLLCIIKNIILCNESAVYGFLTAFIWNIGFLIEKINKLK